MTAHPHRRWTDNMASWKNVILFLIAAASGISGMTFFAWNILARPDIRREVRFVTDPMADAIEFQTYLMMENMEYDKVQRAQERYILSRKARMVK